MLIVHVTYFVKPQKRDAFMRAIAELGVAARSRAEKGCIRYDYSFPAEYADQVYLLEVWEDALCLKAHTETPDFARLQGLKEEYLDGVTIDKFEAARL